MLRQLRPGAAAWVQGGVQQRDGGLTRPFHHGDIAWGQRQLMHDDAGNGVPSAVEPGVGQFRPACRLTRHGRDVQAVEAGSSPMAHRKIGTLLQQRAQSHRSRIALGWGQHAVCEVVPAVHPHQGPQLMQGAAQGQCGGRADGAAWCTAK